MRQAQSESSHTPGPRVSDWRAYALSDASFWLPEYFSESTWLEHAPFAFWLIGALRPSTIVELGTHRGFSYFSFCRAVVGHGLTSRCFAVDHWIGDKHAGFYGNDVYEKVVAHNDARYSAVSRLLRMDFAEAADQFDAGTVDLLHIDGRHYYEDVVQDFAAWETKLSPRSIVLFHDTAVRDRGFGVHQFWSELSSEHPSFLFEHGHGLGVLGFGARQDSVLAHFFDAARDEPDLTAIRLAYSRLGEAVHLRYALEHSGLATELEAMRSSRSWRWTAPLRNLFTRSQ